MVALRSFFKENGTVTAANASPMNDGAAALVIVSGAFLRRHRIEPLARLAGWADAAQKGVDFTTSPALAIPRALAMAGRAIGEVDYFEINEAFSAVALANAKLLGISRERVNAYGGAVALGHALGRYARHPSLLRWRRIRTLLPSKPSLTLGAHTLL